MTAHLLPIPGPRWGERPERRVAPPGAGARANARLRALGERWRLALGGGDAGFLLQVRAAEAQAAVSALSTLSTLPALRLALAREGFTPVNTARALGLVSATAQRTLGVRPFDTQLIGARALLDGRLAEMATGEGKTLTVALAAATAALAGVPVHIVTANDYLVARDAAGLRPLAAALSLTVGAVLPADALCQRRAAYGCHITAVTAKELVFDYLRDTLASPGASGAPEARCLRGLCMAIIDEADAILIDEARVPLILSQAVDGGDATEHAAAALTLARRLTAGEDFRLDGPALGAELSHAGRARVAASAQLAGGAWRHRAHREHAVCTALAALHLFQRERHYLVRDGKVQIVDETTGRVAAGRAWSNGLQPLIELKEGCATTAPLATVAQLTYPRFFARYHRLAGLSGTLREARGELLQTYGLVLRRVPLRLPCRRSVGPHRLFASHAALWPAVAARVAELHAAGRPVMVACDSVAEAQALSQQLMARGLPHATLHAQHDGDEAATVARAGQCVAGRGAITVSTAMAGRGTDIAPDDAARASGGLHVVCCQLGAARRTDRQLAGRAARQGDPGSVETWLSLDTALLTALMAALPAAIARALVRVAPRLPPFAVRALARWPQRREEARQREQRRRLAQRDEHLQRQLGFAGRSE